MRGLGSSNIDSRLRAADFGNVAPEGDARWLGPPFAALATCSACWWSADLRKDHPLFAARIRQPERKGAQVSALNESEQAAPSDRGQRPFAADASNWTGRAGILLPRWPTTGRQVPARSAGRRRGGAPSPPLLGGEKKALLLAMPPRTTPRPPEPAGWRWIASHTGASFGYLTEARNTGRTAPSWCHRAAAEGRPRCRCWVGAAKGSDSLLRNVEPGFDTAVDAGPGERRNGRELRRSSTNRHRDGCCRSRRSGEPPVPFNAEGRSCNMKPFHAVAAAGRPVRLEGAARAGNLLGLGGFGQSPPGGGAGPGAAGRRPTSGRVRPAARLNNRIEAGDPTPAAAGGILRGLDLPTGTRSFRRAVPCN